MAKLKSIMRKIWSNDQDTLRDTLQPLFVSCNSVSVLKSEFDSALCKSKWSQTFRIEAETQKEPDSPVIDEKGLPVATTTTTSPSSETSNVYWTMQECIDYVSKTLQWDDAHLQKYLKTIRKMVCFQCPSATVSTSEFVDAIVSNGCCGPQVPASFVPSVKQAPPLTSHPFFTEKQPVRISWDQFDSLIIVKQSAFCEMMRKIGKDFDELQKRDAKKQGVEQTDDHPILVKKLYKKLKTERLKRNEVFWNTAIGEQWTALKDDTVATITWTEVYQGIFQNMAPTLESDDATGFQGYEFEKTRIGNSLNSLKPSEDADADADDPTVGVDHSTIGETPDDINQLKRDYADLLQKYKTTRADLSKTTALLIQNVNLVKMFQSKASNANNVQPTETLATAAADLGKSCTETCEAGAKVVNSSVQLASKQITDLMRPAKVYRRLTAVKK